MRIGVTGSGGQLGAYVLEALVEAGHEPIAWTGQQTGRRGGVELRPLDLADRGQIARAINDVAPEAVIHLAAVSTADSVRRDPVRARAVNVDATSEIAGWCARRDCRLVHASTDMVFDGSRPWWSESDPVNPILDYGRTKAAGEEAALRAPNAIVARLSLLYGPSHRDQPGFLERLADSLSQGRTVTLFEDEFRTPLSFASAARVLIRLIASEATGLLHVGGTERLSRFAMGQGIAEALGFDPSLVRPNRQADVVFDEPRPADLSLNTDKLANLLPEIPRPDIRSALNPRNSQGTNTVSC